MTSALSFEAESSDSSLTEGIVDTNLYDYAKIKGSG